MELIDKIKNRLEELEIASCWDFGDFSEIRDKEYTANNILEDVTEELYTKEDIYNCLGAFAYKYGITINGNDVTKWLKDRRL